MSNLVKHALALAAQGIPVFPCRSVPGDKQLDKSPACAGGFYAAAVDADVVRRLFANPQAALIGVPTGLKSGFDAFDLDPRHGSDAWWQANLNRIPLTKTHATRSGGKHLLFQHAPGLRCSTNNPMPGCDVRADGGYIIWWPASGCAVDTEWFIEEWPAWMLDSVRAGSGTTDTTEPVGDPASRAGPSTEAVVSLLNAMPHPDTTGRDLRVKVAMAAAGAMYGLDEAAIGEAWIAWAERRPGAGGNPRNNWETKFSVSGGKRAGWPQLLREAVKLGVDTTQWRTAPELDDIPPSQSDSKLRLISIATTKPLVAAKEMIEREFSHRDGDTLRRHNAEWFKWHGTHYAVDSEEVVRAQAYKFLEKCIQGGRGDAFQPARRFVTDFMDALRAQAQFVSRDAVPCWIGDSDLSAADIIAADNGLLHVPTRKLLPHTPRWFSTTVLPYAYDPTAPAPANWLRFLADILPGDAEGIEAVQELFGLVLTSDTSFQKVWLIVGPPRAGKGVIARVLKAVAGAANVCAPTLAGLATNFGLEPLIGQQVAIVGDARLGQQANNGILVERLLSISGEDTLTVDRKHKGAWTGKLPTRLLLISNELPALTDAAGALSSRFIVLKLNRSFLGKEDRGLTDRIVADELPGILNWALAGLDRLRQRGRLVQPASGRAAVEELERLTSPIKAFIADRCSVGPDERVEIDTLHAAFTRWRDDQGWARGQTKERFGRDLHAAIPGLRTERPRVGGPARSRWYAGVGLLPTEPAEDTDFDDLVGAGRSR